MSQFQLVSLCLISSLAGSLTVLMGPAVFLGFIVANMSYQFIKAYRHRELFATRGLIVVFLPVFGQLMIEQVLYLNTPLSVVIQFVGGVCFIWKIIAERKQCI